MLQQNEKDRIINFLEEFGWLLKNYSNDSLGDEIAKFIKQRKQNSLNLSNVEEYTPENPNITFLVGILPSLFMNRKFFPKNEDIAMFAEKVLKVHITRPEKRSQYELIGRIMCEVTTLDDKSLIKVVDELRKYSPTKNKSNDINSWNEVIRKLSGEDYHG